MAVVGAFLVVYGDPLTRDLADLVQRFEHVGIEHLVSRGSIVAFDVGVLIRLAGLDVTEPDALILAPAGEHLREVFRAVFEADRIGPFEHVRRGVAQRHMIDRSGPNVLILNVSDASLDVELFLGGAPRLARPFCTDTLAFQIQGGVARHQYQLATCLRQS